MAIETANYISQLDQSLPTGEDFMSEGDNHIRLTKKAVTQSFPFIDKTVNYSADELNAMKANWYLTSENRWNANGRSITNVAPIDSDNAVQPRSYNDVRYVRVGNGTNAMLLNNDTVIQSNNSFNDGVVNVIGVTSSDIVSVGDGDYSTNIVGSSITINGKLLQDLFTPIGTIYENGLVSTNPALLLGFGTWVQFGTGRVTVAIDVDETVGGNRFNEIGKTGGAVTHQLTVAELPPHDHPMGFRPVTSGSGNNRAANQPNLDNPSNTQKTYNTGDNQPHNNCQPYIVVYRWMRVA